MTKNQDHLALTLEEQKNLLALARQTIGAELKKNAVPDLAPFSAAKFQIPQGVFVTLTEAEELRGCIGNLTPQQPLIQAIQNNARAAAFADPRFPPVTHAELPLLKIEISILTKPQKLTFTSPQDLLAKLTWNQDGVILSKNGACATFLPQVWESMPSKVEFLEHLALKANLDPDAWQTAAYQTYQVKCFREEEEK